MWNPIKPKHIETKYRMKDARIWQRGKWGHVGQRLQTSNYKMNKSGDLIFMMMTIVNNIELKA